MKREDKNLLARQKILDVALKEFSEKGYEAASLNTVWAENGISKGMVYHHFKDKETIYLLCVSQCFEALTAYLDPFMNQLKGTTEERLNAYFRARIRFLTDNPVYLGIFSDASFRPPIGLEKSIAKCRESFDRLNIRILTDLLRKVELRSGLSVEGIVDDFRFYMDFFNLQFRNELISGKTAEAIFQDHELRCQRQIGILLYGVFADKTEL